MSIGAASKAFGLSKTPSITNTSASTCPVNLIGDGRSDTANATVAASNQHVANRTSRQMIPAKARAGGIIASKGNSNALVLPRDASASDRMPKPIQKVVAMSRNILPAPGAIGSIRAHSQTITGDCQSPIVPFAISS